MDVPPPGPGDIMVFAHGNGAIYLGYHDGRSQLVTLDEVLSVAEECCRAGHRVFAGWEQTPLATDAIDALLGAVPTIVRFKPPAPPHTWGDGTNALMEAATVHSDAILDDLIERGADIMQRDHADCTALHHAAQSGNVHAVSALAEAGADTDGRNRLGFTPFALARSRGHDNVAELLAELGANTTIGPHPVMTFRLSHALVMYRLPILWLLLGGAIALALGRTPMGPVAAVALVIACVATAPPRAFWAGGMPCELEQTTLRIRRASGRCDSIDLTTVRFAAIAGPKHRGLGGGLLLLAHPAGHPVSPRCLRRLGTSLQELAEIAPSADRVLVIAIDWRRRDDVVLSVGNVFAALRVPLLDSYHLQLGQAWQRRLEATSDP